MAERYKVDRRDFLKGAAGALGASAPVGAWPALASAQKPQPGGTPGAPHLDLEYPRKFRGAQLQMISAPRGGVAAGSIGLGGRGQLCDWEIHNNPHKGFRPPY